MRAYPQDLRQQVLRAVDHGKSRAEIIDLFQISLATIKRYVKQRRETGTVLPRPIPGRPSKKGAALQMGVQELLEAHPEARKPRVLPMVGSYTRHTGEPSYDEPGDPRDGLGAKKGEEQQSERSREEEPLSSPKLLKQALEKRWWGRVSPGSPEAPQHNPGLQPPAYGPQRYRPG
jgi:hypothetical protein